MPKQIGEYEIGKTLGRGKYSKVKYAVHIKSGKAYAMKILNLKDVRREQMETQLRKEIAIMKMIQNEHVVQLKDVLQTDRHIYISMELVTGGELFEKIVAAERFDENVSRRYFQQLVIAVSHCHTQGIAHRDLKPENLLLGADDKIKITDFGLSTLAKGRHGKKQVLKTTCGTPNYVAPEVLREEGYEGFKADIWSIGVILFVMLAGYLPFDDNDVEVLFKKIESGKLNYPPFFSKGAKSLLQSMLMVDPEKRASLTDIKRHPWFKVGFTEPSTNAKKIVVTEGALKRSITESSMKNISNSSIEGSMAAEPPMDAFQLLSGVMGFSATTLATVAKREHLPLPSTFIEAANLTAARKIAVAILKKCKSNPRAKLIDDKVEVKCFFFSKLSGTILTFSVILKSSAVPTLTHVHFQLTKGDQWEFAEHLEAIAKGFNMHAKQQQS